MKLRLARKVGKLAIKRGRFHRGTTASRSRWRLTRSILTGMRRKYLWETVQDHRTRGR